ncbi:MAG: hypothetical protein WCZ66_07955 [Sphingomonadaceae bacterium]
MDKISTVAAAPSAETLALRQAGQAFEALVLEKLMKSARPAVSGAEGEWRSLADRQVAAEISRSSPMGLAHLLEKAVK